MKKITFWSGGLLALVLAMTACASPPQASSGGSHSVVMAQSGDFVSYGPLYIAIDKGYFKQQGLDLRIVRANGGPQAISAMLSGGANFSIGTTSQFLPAVIKGQPVRFVAPITSQLQSNSVIDRSFAAKKGVTATSSFDDKLRAMQGATVGVTSVGGGIEQALRYLLNTHGMNADKDVRIVAIGNTPSSWVAAMKQHRIDVAFSGVPIPEYIEATGDAIPFITISKGEAPGLDGILDEVFGTTQQFADQHPDEVLAFAKAIAQAQHFIVSNKQEAMESMYRTAFTSLPKPAFERAYDDLYDAFYKTPVLNTADYTRSVDYVSKSIKKPIDAPADKVFLLDVAKQAAASVQGGK